MWEALPSESMDAVRTDASETQTGTYPCPGVGDGLPAPHLASEGS